MNIIIHTAKLNRLFRRAMDRYYQEFLINATLSNDELDDINNMYAGCAFE